jgi:hypothetical protein
MRLGLQVGLRRHVTIIQRYVTRGAACCLTRARKPNIVPDAGLAPPPPHLIIDTHNPSIVGHLCRASAFHLAIDFTRFIHPFTTRFCLLLFSALNIF